MRSNLWAFVQALEAREPALTDDQREFLEHARSFRFPAPEDPGRAQRDAAAEARSRMRTWMCGYLENTSPIARQRPDSHLGDVIGLTELAKKGSVMHLMAGDIELAQKMSRKQGWPLAKCLAAITKVNVLNTPSYLGGDLLEKGSMKKQSKKKLNKAIDELLLRSIVPDSSDVSVRKQGYSDFRTLYYGMRRQIVDNPKFSTR